MSRVLVTGSRGFIGKNLIEQLEKSNHQIFTFNRGDSVENLKDYLEESEFIYHLAAVNRPNNDEEFEIVNVGLTKTIVDILYELNNCPTIVFSSSIQAVFDNLYGRSKKAAEDILINYKNRTGAKVYIYRLPNVFGKWAKPNYNSVVATFMYNIVNGKEIWISDEHKILELVYIDDVIKSFLDILNGIKYDDVFLEIRPVYSITLGKLAEAISMFKKGSKNFYESGISKELVDKLYKTFLYYLSCK
jgi:UDP-2-acetamido-2,6-beta-L-arabino-hexul-4-ose reductase